MGIRLDQLHNEVFDKIGQDIKNSSTSITDFLENKIAEIDIVFGLPETTVVERDAEVNKRNLEKSGFIEINRNFMPIRMGDQAETGVWVSNLDENESPFEAATIDGQKRGINVAGQNINYTRGNIGQDINKMMKLPVAPNLPVFFPEDNDMRYYFQPKKTIIHNKVVTDLALQVTIGRRITDEYKIDIDKFVVGDTTQYYYMDEDSNTFYLNEDGRTFRQNAPDELLVEPYGRYNVSFGDSFQFEKIFNSNAEIRYVDYELDSSLTNDYPSLYRIVDPTTPNADKYNLKIDTNRVFIEDMTVTRFEEVDGVLVEKEVTQPMLVKFDIVKTTINGMETEILNKVIVSEKKFEKNTVTLSDNNDYTKISDAGIDMWVKDESIYYYHPYRIVKRDDEGATVFEADENGVDYWYDAAGDVVFPAGSEKAGQRYTSADVNTVNISRKAVYVEDTDYRLYLPIGSTKPTYIVDGQPVEGIEVTDNITGNKSHRDIYSIAVESIEYYRQEELSDNLAVWLMEDGSLRTATTLISAGKEYYYHHEVGTKYYKKDNGAIYYLSSISELFEPTNDVQEIFEGTLNNVDTLEVSNKMIYTAGGLTYFIDSEGLRTYIENEEKVQMVLTNLDGYRVFEKTQPKKAQGTEPKDSDGNLLDEDGKIVYETINVFVKNSDTMITMDGDNEQTYPFSFLGLTPVFETEEVEEDVLNLEIPIAFNIVQGNVVLQKNTDTLAKYSDYNVDATLSLDKPLEFYEGERNDNNKGWKFKPQGDLLYIRRAGKKDIVMRMEKTGNAVFPDGNGGFVDIDNNPVTGVDVDKNHWVTNTGNIVFAEPLTGNSFDWTDGQEVLPGQQLDYNDIVKKDTRYFQYTGAAVSYDDMPENNKTIVAQESGMFWEDVTVMELEYERKGQNYKVFNAAEGETIRFTIVRRVWEQHAVTGEMIAVEKAPYVVERVAQQDGENLFVLNDQNFLLDDNASLESYILTLENIKLYGVYKDNRANDFRLTLTGLQTVALNEDSAMIYGDDYFLSDNVLYLTEAEMTDNMSLLRIQAPQAELKIDLKAEIDQPKVTVPFDIIKNKYDIVIPQELAGHEYTWIMGDELPEGKTLMNGDVVFDKDNIKFFKFVGETKGTTINDGGVNTFIPTPKESLLRLPEETQKELARQFMGISENLNPGQWFNYFDVEWVKLAEELSKSEGLSLTYWNVVDGTNVLNTEDEKVSDYLRIARENLVLEATAALNDGSFDAGEIVTTAKLTTDDITTIKSVLNSDLDQSVLKLVKYNKDGTPVLDEDGNIIYDYKYTRNFYVEQNEKGEFITRNISGNEEVDLDNWEDITAPEVGYYRFGKTFTILETKAKDNIVVRLNESGAEEFTTKRVTSEGGEITFAVDFNIEEDDGSEIPFTVVYEEINWTEGIDYIQEGQDLTLTMVEEAGQEIIIRRNDEFDLIDIVVLERKDLVFIEVWHEAVNETGYIFPFGNVQFVGAEVDGVPTQSFDHVYYDTVDGEQAVIPDGHKKYCQVYQKGNIVYNYYAGTEFDPVDKDEKKFIDETFKEDSTIGKGWKLDDLEDEDRKKIFHNPDHNLYFDGEKLIQIRYRTRCVALNLFDNYFRGTSEYMSKDLKFQGKSPVTSRIVTREIGEYGTDTEMAGQPITETVQNFVGGNLVISSNEKSLLYKQGKLYDDALFTVEEPTELSHNGYVYAVPVAIVNRRNQGVYHPEFNDNGTGFFINGIYVSEDKEDFADDISGFTLIDENRATLETASTGRDRKAKFKVMLKWLFNGDYKAGGSMVSRTTYRPDGLLYDEINTKDIIDLRIDANDQRKRIEDLESDVDKGFKELYELRESTATRFEQTTNYINTTANLIYSHIGKTEEAIRKDMNDKDDELTASLEETNTNLADLSANVFTKDVSKNLIIDSLFGIINDMDDDAFNTFASNTFGTNPNGLPKPDRDYISGMISSFVENMEGPYTKPEFMKFLVTVLKLVTDKTMYSETVLDLYIKRLSVKDLSMDASTEVYTRAEQLELIYEGLILASSARVLPPIGADNKDNWEFAGKRYAGWKGSKHLDLKKDFLENGLKPVATKNVKAKDLNKTYSDRLGNVWNSGFIAGPTVWGNVHNYHAIYTTWIFVDKPFDLEYVKMNGDDPHAIYINEERVATNKYCCRDTAYSYSFSVPGWYRIDAMYSERSGGHYVQLGWNPTDYATFDADGNFVSGKIRYMTTKNMDDQVRITKLRLDNWASKTKSLVSTIPGDATGTFTKLETKLILIEGLKRIRTHILDKGTDVTEDDLNALHISDSDSLQNWLDTGTYSSLGYNAYTEDDDSTDVDETTLDLFRPVESEPGGYYNKDEVIAIVQKSLQLINGIDSLNSSDIQKWVERLYIRINMDVVTYFTKAQIDQVITAGKNYLAGLDSVTSYEIEDWLKAYIQETFYDANGTDLTRNNAASSSYTRAKVGTTNGLKETVLTEMQSFLGAQSAKSSD